MAAVLIDEDEHAVTETAVGAEKSRDGRQIRHVARIGKVAHARLQSGRPAAVAGFEISEARDRAGQADVVYRREAAACRVPAVLIAVRAVRLAEKLDGEGYGVHRAAGYEEDGFGSAHAAVVRPENDVARVIRPLDDHLEMIEPGLGVYGVLILKGDGSKPGIPERLREA